MISLSDIRDSFEGVIPSVIATSDGDGIPNISYLSHVYYVDESHVALSNQFFSKTAANVRASGVATLMVVDGRSGVHHMLDLEFLHALDHGELFERIKSHLSVMSAQQGMAGVMKLRSADLYFVRDCRAVVGVVPPKHRNPAPATTNHLPKAALLAAAIGSEADADVMLDKALAGLESSFDYRHAMVLVPDETAQRLSTLASRGYSSLGVGAEIAFGEGVIGIAAATRQPVRICDLRRSQRYASAILSASDRTRHIPLPGLAGPRSQMAVPMLAQGKLRGVLFIESEASFAFGHQDEDALMLVASQLAAGLRLAELEGGHQPNAFAKSTQGGYASDQAGAPSFKIRYFAFDDSVFIDDDYLIKGVPGRLLIHLVRTFLATGRRDFSNREIRRDATLRLPDIKDNLETRLILLRRRLDEKSAPIRLLRPERGHIRLDLAGVPLLEAEA
ncbi:hypothetical protein MesoLj113c_13200 [Mesorhizobium sp. 113-3-9]|uniref:GAF domain-containing protein n=1 Tax=Mesorhizobium sp. 113-3-9 TaxID=2744517 RepID=UPI001926EF31|nr:GAF domain-containing protein [Mesorhizobium sp. 113-3-9]BCG85210.1 hypothetical protein MesoLj113c_13200 [Mesorhizobium sp. 113-3-9]